MRAVRRLSRRGEEDVFQSRSFRFFPAPASRDELADLVGRYNWYLGDLGADVRVAGLSRNLSVDSRDAAYLDPALVTPPPMLVDDHDGPAHVLIHRVTPASLLAIVRARGAASIVDPRFHALDDSFEYFELRRRLAGSSGCDDRSALKQLLSLGGTGKTALVVGTGPGSREVLNQSAGHDIRIVCNSAIRDEVLMRHVEPNIVTFSDHVFHLGPSRYAAEFRRDVARVASGSDCLFVVPDFSADLLLAHHPELSGRVIGLKILPWDSEWRSVTKDNVSVRETGNVLTKYMLPVAFGLADLIDVSGCDGRKPGESYFWSHGPTVQYSDEMMRSVFEAHLSFFRDNDYSDYYERHCTMLEDMLRWGERVGKTVRCVTSSYIPALASRKLG